MSKCSRVPPPQVVVRPQQSYQRLLGFRTARTLQILCRTPIEIDDAGQRQKVH